MKTIRAQMIYMGTVIEIVMRVPAIDPHSLRRLKNLLETNGRVAGFHWREQDAVDGKFKRKEVRY
jgi:hypothetical protein